jgi:AcrR family transcriptional regulator
MTLDTRSRIVAAAAELFARNGFHDTSVRENAEQVGVTKAAVLYHFAGKAEIIGALTEPLLTDLERAVDAAARIPDPEAARWATIEALLEVYLTHRLIFRMNLHDMGMLATEVYHQRFTVTMLRANQTVSGPDPTLADRVLAAQALGMLGDPIVLFVDEPADEIRTLVLAGLHRLLGPRPAGVPSQKDSQKSSQKRGRPAVLDLDEARSLQQSGLSPTEIATSLGVSRATVYRHLKS